MTEAPSAVQGDAPASPAIRPSGSDCSGESELDADTEVIEPIRRTKPSLDKDALAAAETEVSDPESDVENCIAYTDLPYVPPFPVSAPAGNVDSKKPQAIRRPLSHYDPARDMRYPKGTKESWHCSDRILLMRIYARARRALRLLGMNECQMFFFGKVSKDPEQDTPYGNVEESFFPP